MVSEGESKAIMVREHGCRQARVQAGMAGAAAGAERLRLIYKQQAETEQGHPGPDTGF